MGVSLGAKLPKLIVLTCLSVYYGIFVSCDEECSPGIKGKGYTVPKGDITIRYGDPLDIYCILSEEEARRIGPNASQRLVFKRNRNVLSQEMVQIINSTTIKLHVDKPAKGSNENYMCNLEGEGGVCMNFVSVGVPPQPITDFKCISNNWDNLTCRWTAPENYVKTDYNLSYSLKRTRTLYNCPAIEESGNIRTCMWNLSTEPIYRQSVPEYNFFLNASNALGTYTMPTKPFNHFGHVRPRAPENLKVLSKTWNSVNLSWTVPTTVQTFPKGLIHRVLYQSAYGENREWQSKPVFKKSDVREVQFNLDNLEYAHGYYDIRVSLRSAVADINDQSMWSDNASLTVLTASKRPDEPPRTNIGSFEILTLANNSDRNVRIYWSKIPEKNTNGENFSYVVTLDGKEVNATKNAYMLLERLVPHKSYTFHIWARNEMGISDESSVITIPTYQDCAREPTRLIKEELGDGHYRLSWQPPKLESRKKIRNYTLFWCNDERDRPPCNGKLDWVVVPGSLTSYNQTIPSNKTYQFAISTNTDRGSSGMTWAHCTDSYYKYNIGRINEFWRLELGSTYVTVKWSFGCPDKSVTGFIIYYCPILSPQTEHCKGSEKNETFNSTVTTATIKNIDPYTTYTLQVAAVINHTSYSMRSERMQVTTSEAAPSTPPLLNVLNVTNSTITMAVTQPTVTNGVLKYYNIIINNKAEPADRTGNVTYVTLKNLTSFMKYVINVEACTTACSEPSETVIVQTKIGYPSVIRKLSVNQNNITYTNISWERPQDPNGRIERYELRIKEKRDSENITTIINTTEPEWGMHRCGKEKKYNSFYVSVRAVNLDDNKEYYGKWSNELESYCVTPSNYIIYILVPAIIMFLLAMTYLFKKLYGIFKEMRDFGVVKLPQGLQGEVTETEINLTNWKQKPAIEDGDHQSADDEERLLMRKSQGSPKLATDDSSGCSSAHGSVSCSADSASNISSGTSDSGTEQPRTQSTEDLTDLAVTTSLRQRNIRPPKAYVALPLETNNPGGTKLAPKSYCVLGVDSNISPDGSSSYIPPPSMGDKPLYSPSESPHSPPYVLTGELVKTTNPNYIPFKSPPHPADSSARNPAYVIAGNTDLLAPSVLNIENKQPQLTPQDNTYIKIVDNMALKNADINSWQPPSLSTNAKTGYVSIGEVPPLKKEPKGYVPHRQFESKALKED